MNVLEGTFKLMTVREVEKMFGRPLVADGIYAVPSIMPPLAALPPTMPLLEILCDKGRHTIYLLAHEARVALHLSGPHAHLFDLLCAHSVQHHNDRHLATHVATVYRKREGHVLVNAHPAFANAASIVGMINEPAAGEKANLNMIASSAKLVLLLLLEHSRCLASADQPLIESRANTALQ